MSPVNPNLENEYNSSSPRESLFKKAVDHIESLIVSGEYTVGSKLPTEKELCETLCVSRTIVREALRAVESKGLLEVFAGKGAFVREPNYDSIILPMEVLIANDKVEILDLIQARHFLEPGIAHVAALKCTEEDIEVLYSNLQNMISNIDSGDAFITADQEYHRNLAMATKNPVLCVMATAVVQSLITFRKTIYEVEGAPAKAVKRHAEILDALRNRDAQAAYRAMESHIIDAEEHQHLRLMQNSLNNLNFGISAK